MTTIRVIFILVNIQATRVRRMVYLFVYAICWFVVEYVVELKMKCLYIVCQISSAHTNNNKWWLLFCCIFVCANVCGSRCCCWCCHSQAETTARFFCTHIFIFLDVWQDNSLLFIEYGTIVCVPHCTHRSLNDLHGVDQCIFFTRHAIVCMHDQHVLVLSRQPTEHCTKVVTFDYNRFSSFFAVTVATAHRLRWMYPFFRNELGSISLRNEMINL